MIGKLKAILHPESDRTIYVNQKQMNIIESIMDHKKTISEISTITGMTANQLSYSVNFLVKKGYLINHGASFEAKKLNFVVADMDKVHKFNALLGEREEVIPEIEVFKPTRELKDQIFDLHKSGYSRSEIAKRLVIPKSQVLWTLMEGNKS